MSRVKIDLKTGGKLWVVPLGSFTRLFGPEFAAQVKEEWGSPNLGGPIVTAGGKATPMRYQFESGEQVVGIAEEAGMRWGRRIIW